MGRKYSDQIPVITQTLNMSRDIEWIVEKSKTPIELTCQNCDKTFMSTHPRFTCSTICRKQHSRSQEAKRIETEVAVRVSRDFFLEIKGCKTCGFELIPDGLVKLCGNLKCRDFDVQ